MKLRIMVFVLAMSLAAFAQGRRGGMGSPTGGSMSGGMGPTMSGGHDRGGDMDRDHGKSGDTDDRHSHGQAGEQRPLNDAQVNSGAFRMLEKKTGMTATQLEALYKSSGAKNFGQFVSAIVVSKNLGLDTNKVLDGLKTQSLGQTLQSLGVAPDKAKSEIKKAHQEIKDSEKNS